MTRLPVRIAGRLGALVSGAVAPLVLAGRALAESPVPSQAVAGDPRTGGAAGFAGDPGFAIAAVALIALAALAATLAWVRATGGPAPSPADGEDAKGR